MKKFFALMIAVMISAVCFSQSAIPTFTYKNADSKFSKQLKEGSIVYIADSNQYWGLTSVAGANSTMGDVLTAGTYVPLYALDQTGENLILTGYLKVGSQTLTQTTVNKATFNNSLGVTDTLTAAVMVATGNITSSATLYGAVVDVTGTWTDYIYMSAQDTTIGDQLGRIVFNESDSSWYGCWSTVGAHNWVKLNN